MGEAGTAYVHPDIRPEVERVVSFVESDEAVQGFKNFLDGWNTAWKSSATMPLVAGPSFFSRNMTGNLIASYMEGVRNPLVYKEAARLQAAVRSARKEFPDLPVPAALEAAGNGADAAIIEGALERGVLNEGFYTVELPGEAISRTAGASRKRRALEATNIASSSSALNRGGMKVNAALENNARLAHFLSKVQELGDMDAAASSVKKALFDYGDLTDFERRVAKRGVAFYTYLRKNTPLQIRNIVEKPARVVRVQNAMETALGTDREQDGENGRVQGGFIPSWAPLRGGLLAPESGRRLTGGDNPVFAQVDTPFTSGVEALAPAIEAGRLAAGGGSGEELARAVLNVASGGPVEAMKIAAEEATGTSLFTGGSLRDRETGERKQSAVLRLSQAIAPVVAKIDRVGGDVSDSDSRRLALVRALTGLQAREITDEDSEKAASFTSAELGRALSDLRRAGVDVPTLAELKRIGLVPDPKEDARERERASEGGW
jgi:hypothetical protein